MRAAAIWGSPSRVMFSSSASAAVVGRGQRAGGRRRGRGQGGRRRGVAERPGEVVQAADRLDHVLAVLDAPPVLVEEPVQRRPVLGQDGDAQRADQQQRGQQAAEAEREFLAKSEHGDPQPMAKGVPLDVHATEGRSRGLRPAWPCGRRRSGRAKFNVSGRMPRCKTHGPSAAAERCARSRDLRQRRDGPLRLGGGPPRDAALRSAMSGRPDRLAHRVGPVLGSRPRRWDPPPCSHLRRRSTRTVHGPGRDGTGFEKGPPVLAIRPAVKIQRPAEHPAAARPPRRVSHGPTGRVEE